MAHTTTICGICKGQYMYNPRNEPHLEKCCGECYSIEYHYVVFYDTQSANNYSTMKYSDYLKFKEKGEIYYYGINWKDCNNWIEDNPHQDIDN